MKALNTFDVPELVQSCRVHGIVILCLYSLFFGPLSPLQAALADLQPVNFARYRLGSVTKVLTFGASSSGRVGFTFSLSCTSLKQNRCLAVPKGAKEHFGRSASRNTDNEYLI